MEEKKYNITLPEGTNELIIREGDAAEARERLPLKIYGNIDTPLRFLKNRYEEKLKAGSLSCHIVVNKEEGIISLLIDENEELRDEVGGSIKVSEKIKGFNINNGEFVTPEQLANFLRMRKHLFLSPADYSSTFTALRSFTAKVQQEITAIKDDSGNYDSKRQQAVEHNVPKSFRLSVPIFKGMPKCEMEVEILVDKNLNVTLYSADLIQMTDELRDRYVEDTVTEIEKVAPDIVILYQ